MKTGYPFDGKPWFYYEALGEARRNILAAREGWYTHGIAYRAAEAFIKCFPTAYNSEDYRTLQVMKKIKDEAAALLMERNGRID